MQKAEAQRSQLSQQLEALRTDHSSAQAEASAQRARQQADMAERERRANENASALRQECFQLRQALGQQQASSARQLSDLQAAMRLQQQKQEDALLAANVPPMSSILSNGLQPAIMDSTVPIGAGEGEVQVEALRAQLALAQKRLGMGSEYRQLSESYKAKAERLQQQLVEERAQVQSQAQLWKEQMHVLRTRARADKEKLLALQQRVGAVGTRQQGSVSPVAFRGLGSTPSTYEGHNGTPRKRASLRLSYDGGTPATRDTAPASSNRSVKGLLSEVDSRVNRAFDRMEGVSKEFVGRFVPLRSQTDRQSATNFTQIPTDSVDD